MNKESEIRVLVIEDEAGVRMGISAYLDDQGFTVLEAENGEIGLEEFHNNDPDVLLVDLWMPKMDGFEVLAEVQKKSPETPVIVVSGAGVIEEAIKAIHLGAWDFIAKPIQDMSIIEHAIQKAWERVVLSRENQRYRENLENEVRKRTFELQKAHSELELRVVERTKQLEEQALELVEAKEAAEAANRTKSAFLANMSHELRTPMNAILGFAELMGRDKSLNTTQQEYLGIIIRSGTHLLDLINDVLDMSKIEAGQVTLNVESFDLHQALLNIEKMVRLRAENKNLCFTLNYDSDLPRYVRTDENKLRQILLNLLGNAIKFTEEGCISLRVESRKLPMLNEENDIPGLFFEVEDTGAGIAPDEIGVLFDPFTQTKSGQNVQEGTGLGLSISREFVWLMAGNIAVESPPLRSTIHDGHTKGGPGSLFKFYIRVESAGAQEIQIKERGQRVIGLEPGQEAFRILVVEDKIENRLFLKKLLQLVGFEVQEASNGKEGVEKYKKWNPHLILMDVRMPVMDGYDATRQIRKHELEAQIDQSRQIPIIALTASVFERDKSSVLLAGATDFMRKPFHESELFEAMGKYLKIRYLYSDLEDQGEGFIPNIQTSIFSKNPSNDALLAEALTGLPEWLLSHLRQATLELDVEKMLDHIAQVRKHDHVLAESLENLAKNFQYEKLLSFFEQ
ncbi:MAG: response regulator [SAR324 cluster bacterium]|nr:response regulator [SAR324 cluster bacterium]